MCQLLYLQVVTNYEDLLSQATGIEALEGQIVVVDSFLLPLTSPPLLALSDIYL